jgi:hypothetical protein
LIENIPAYSESLWERRQKQQQALSMTPEGLFVRATAKAG